MQSACREGIKRHQTQSVCEDMKDWLDGVGRNCTGRDSRARNLLIVITAIIRRHVIQAYMKRPPRWSPGFTKTPAREEKKADERSVARRVLDSVLRR